MGLCSGLVLIFSASTVIAQNGLKIASEWEAQITLPTAIGWSPPSVYEFKDRTFFVFTTAPYTYRFAVLLDQNHKTIWTSPASGWIGSIKYNNKYFVITGTVDHSQYSQLLEEATLYKETAQGVVEIGKISNFSKGDEAMISVDAFGGRSDVASHEESADARFSETDTSMNLRSASVNGTSGTITLRVRHYLCGDAPAPGLSVEQPVGTPHLTGVTANSFGTLKIGKSSSVTTFTLKNVGDANLANLAVTKDGISPGDFVVTAPLKTSLAAGASTTFGVTFKPTKSGTRTAAIHVKSNDINKSPFDINLYGQGTN